MFLRGSVCTLNRSMHLNALHLFLHVSFQTLEISWYSFPETYGGPCTFVMVCIQKGHSILGTSLQLKRKKQITRENEFFQWTQH